MEMGQNPGLCLNFISSMKWNCTTNGFVLPPLSKNNYIIIHVSNNIQLNTIDRTVCASSLPTILQWLLAP